MPLGHTVIGIAICHLEEVQEFLDSKGYANEATTIAREHVRVHLINSFNVFYSVLSIVVIVYQSVLYSVLSIAVICFLIKYWYRVCNYLKTDFPTEQYLLLKNP